MKINKYFKALFVGAMMVGAGVFTSCEDEPDKFELTDGIPEVQYVRMPYLSQADSLIVEASTESIICLVGNNLTSIQQIYFNDQKAMLNTSYITNHTLIVRVPEGIPAVVSDKIYMITAAKDTVTYDFHVVVPGPSLTAMSCEYVRAGESVTLYGNYFIDDPNVPLTVTLPDGQTVTEFTSFSQGEITFNMPQCDVEGPISVSTIYGKVESPFHYLDSRGMLFDFDGLTGLGNHGWHPRDILSDETSITGNFVQLGDGIAKMSEDGGWNDGAFSFEYWCGDWNTPQNITSGDGIALYNLVDFTNWEKMSLKFEMYIPSSNPWTSGAMQIAFEGVDKVTLSGNPIDGYTEVKGANAKIFNGEDGMGDWGRAMYRPWTATGSYDTGNRWVTVTIPLTTFTADRSGVLTQNTFKSALDFGSLTIFVLGGGINGVECAPIIKIDNIRAVPNK
ncbi:MAG: hypothetical protein IJ604_11090 [Prevotella sp.]|nr:hypothetical protein [Prevotella sp.]